MVNERLTEADGQRPGGPALEPKSSHTQQTNFVASLGFLSKVCCVERLYYVETRPSELDDPRGEAAEARASHARRYQGLIPLSSILLGALEGERGEPSSEGIRAANVHKIQLTEGNPIASPPSEPAEERKPDTASYLPADTQATPLAPADGRACPMSPLLKAIVEPDIYTAHADRERAIVLRWVLRDIKANRLKLSPVSQHDLQNLIDIGLVEMLNDAPVLTNAGVSAIV